MAPISIVVVAFDGDGDRVLMLDHRGECIDGDHILFALAHHHQRMGQPVPGVVGTVMSNQGLAQALSEIGVSFERAKVGDAHVAALLRQRQWRFGAEPSGHVIDLAFASTGDGLSIALQWLAIMAETGMRADAWRVKLSKFPQVLISVPVHAGYDFQACEPLMTLVAQYQHQLSGGGRVLLRPSGTEAVMRVMVEGRDSAMIHKMAKRLSACIVHENTNHVSV